MIGYRRADVSASETTGNPGVIRRRIFRTTGIWRTAAISINFSLTFRADYSLSSATSGNSHNQPSRYRYDRRFGQPRVLRSTIQRLQTFSENKRHSFRTGPACLEFIHGKTDLTVYYRNNGIAQNPHCRGADRAAPIRAGNRRKMQSFTVSVQMCSICNICSGIAASPTGLSIDRVPNAYEALFYKQSIAICRIFYRISAQRFSAFPLWYRFGEHRFYIARLNFSNTAAAVVFGLRFR